MSNFRHSRARRPRILLAAVDHELSSMLARVLSLAGYDMGTISTRGQLGEVLAAEDVADVLGLYDLLICEAQLLDDAATKSVESVQKRGLCPPLILITAFAGDEVLERVNCLNTEARFERAFDTFEHLMTIRQIVPLQPPNA